LQRMNENDHPAICRRKSFFRFTNMLSSIFLPET